jgi:hypothetical protein
MNWLKRRLRNWVNNLDEAEQVMKMSSKHRGLAISTSDGEILSTEPLRLSIYRANGGTVVETRVYDRQKDRSQNQLHIVSHDDDLGRSLAKIITLESLRG